MHMCNKCMKMGGLSLLIFGVLFLLQDLNVWNFWNINWYTIAFIMIGFAVMGCGGCKECVAISEKKRK